MAVCGAVCGAVHGAVCAWQWALLLGLGGWTLAEGAGLQLPGHYSISGMFPLHNTAASMSGRPVLASCEEGSSNKHGYHLIQAMRLAVEEINNGTKDKTLLPGVKLGYQAYDICSIPASLLATLDLLGQQYQRGAGTGLEGDPGSVAVIGPDSSSYTFTPAALLGAYLVPQISYEASNEMLSNKHLYPSFFRTIPSDKNQVAAMLQLLVRFQWTWIALLGSNNDYGLQGMRSLFEQAEQSGVCIAYQGVIPTLTRDNHNIMTSIVQNILKTKVNTIVVFSSKRIVRGFFEVVVKQNVTGKVWIGTEDWSVASLVSDIPGIQTIGTVLGMSVKYAAIPQLKDFESQTLVSTQQSDTSGFLTDTMDTRVECLQRTDLYSLAAKNFPLEKYDITSAFNVYTAVYAVAHALHQCLGCDSGECQHTDVQPWQLLPWLKKVRFSVENSSVYFDQNGDPPTGYDIVTWIWRGTSWSLRVVGSYSPDPTALTVNAAQVEWMTSSGAAPLSRCSPDCPAGHMMLQKGQHKCCFDCMACPAAYFLNKSEATTCQLCPPLQWAPPKSEMCLDRTVLLLAWDAPHSIILLVLLALTMLLTLGSGLIFLLNLDTPVAKSAGGRTCLLMLASLTLAAASALCHFGRPSGLACVLKQPLFILSFSVCMSCVTVRAVQVVCIFKLASRLPRAYDTWAKNSGPEVTILLLTGLVLLISVLRVSLNPPYPSQDLDFYPDSIVIECSHTMSPGAMMELAYLSLLSVICFSFSYMGKDLPANYNEAKCVTFSLMVYMISWASFFTVYVISRGQFAMMMHVLAIVSSVLGILFGYFLPKVYIIVLRPQMNTTAHFQNCIQMYTMNKQ